MRRIKTPNLEGETILGLFSEELLKDGHRQRLENAFCRFRLAWPQKSEPWLGHSQNHLAVAGGYVVDALDFVNVSEMPATYPPATARWF